MEVVTATSPIRYFFFIQSPINSAFSQQISTTHNHSWPSISSIHLRSSSFRHKGRFSHRFVACNSLQNSADDATSDRIAVLLEVDGVLIDAYRSGNRHAFNRFKSLDWTVQTGQNLYIRTFQGFGDEDRMLALYFNRIGWPTSLPTSEKDSFMKSVLEEKKKALAEFVSSKNTPLRPGIEKFIDDACDEGICVVILIASSKFGEETAREIVEKLGVERMLKVKVVGKKEIEESLYGQLILGLGKFSGLDEELANAASKAIAAEKKRIAEEVASMLKLRVDINTGTPERLREIVAALRAAAENAVAPISNCVLVAGSQPLIAAAETAGLPCIVLRNSLTSRAEFPSAAAVMDGFGDADLTISKVRLALSRLSQ
ncbi:CBBY-like protein isoform X4 [Spinacia oleracea]|uniref:CBBY-like protein isoform X4 n=1 Tax=Spinacia oleracea TaxID=3562 RepID=A0ABM3RAV7_SPIOL|nr:CBBY-like protein isoform X4 [Spinacia oleracea]